MWAAWPVVLAGADVPDAAKFRRYEPRSRHWFYGEAFAGANANRYHRLVLLGRFTMMPLSLAGLYLVFACARRMYGDAAGVGAGAAYALNPSICAHGSIVGTD